jgi:hypothetical protein
MTRQEAVGSALSKGTVTPEMMQAAGAMNDPTKAKAAAVKMDLDWAKLHRQQNADRLREMSILLNQNYKDNSLSQKISDTVAEMESDQRDITKRKNELTTLYNKSARGERVRMQIEGVDTQVSSDDLNEMIANASKLESEMKSAIDEVKSKGKGNNLSPARINTRAGANKVTQKYEAPETSPAPVTSTPSVKPTLSITPKPLSSPQPQNDPLGIR